MKVLFYAAGTSPASVFAIAPLVTAVRNAGHEVLVAAFDELTASIEAVGLPPVAVVTTETTESIKTMDRPGGHLEFPPPVDQEAAYSGGWFARQAAVSLPGMLRLADEWCPDLLVGGTLAYVTGLVSAHLGIPHVRQTWDWVDFRTSHPYADRELRPELDELGLAGVPEPDMCIDICPPSLRPPDAAPARPMRWIPGNRQRKLEPWMYTRSERRRVCVTLGSFRTSQAEMLDYLHELVDRLAVLDVELVVATTEDTAATLRHRHPGVHSGWVPLEFLVPSCDLVVHHAGGLTALAAMAAGVPQLILTRFELYDDSLARLEEHGSGAVLHRGEDTSGNAAEACGRLLSDPGYADRARELAREIAGLPPPPTLLGALEDLAVRRPAAQMAGRG